jgi:N-acetylglutamate synthase-like GNAT family acetyltransferase
VAHTIRKTDASDADVLARLIRAAYRDVAERFGLTFENAPTHPSNCQPAWIERDLERGVSYFLLSVEATPCGCVALELATPSLAYLERLAVVPEFRHRGLGAELVARAVAEAVTAGARRVSVGVIAAHEEVVDWYREQGFELDETREFSHLPFTVAFLQRSLP